MIETFSPGDRWANSREKLNSLVAELVRVGALRGDGIIAVDAGPGGATIRLSVEALLPRIPKTGLFPVLVTQTGGAAGDATTQCSFVYDVTLVTGDPFGEGMAPVKPRPEFGKMVAPATDSYGLAFVDESAGGPVLWDAGEVPAVAVCP
jgi:hypothetical protein